MWLAKLHNHSPMKITFFNGLSSNSELASVKAHDREVTQQAKYAQDEVVFFIFQIRPTLVLDTEYDSTVDALYYLIKKL